jgi:hypothetical protein
VWVSLKPRPCSLHCRLRTGQAFHICVASLLAAAVLCRLFLPVRGGGLGPDELELALRASSFLSGAPLPLLGLMGTHGLPNGPHPTYILIFIYWITHFHFGWAYLVYSALLVLAAFLVAVSVRREGYPFWTLTLALTSPLAVYFSMQIWDNPFLIPCSALLCLILSLRRQNSCPTDFTIGTLLGVALGIHPQALPFAVAVITWRFMNSRRRSTIVVMASGLALTLLPYAVGLWRVWDRLRITIGGTIVPVPQLSLPPLAFLTSIFRFVGAQPVGRLNCSGQLLMLENLIVGITSILSLVLLAGAVYCVARHWRLWLSRESMRLFYVLCAVLSVLFLFVTNAFGPQYTQAIWWFAPVVIPIVAMQILPRKWATLCLSLMVGFNVLATGIQYAIRTVHGTSAESARYYWSGSLGPSWWMLKDVVNQISRIEDQYGQAGLCKPLTVRLCPVKFSSFAVPNTMRLFDPQRAARIRWAGENEKNWDVSVQADRAGILMQVISRNAPHSFEACE